MPQSLSSIDGSICDFKEDIQRSDALHFSSLESLYMYNESLAVMDMLRPYKTFLSTSHLISGWSVRLPFIPSRTLTSASRGTGLPYWFLTHLLLVLKTPPGKVFRAQLQSNSTLFDRKVVGFHSQSYAGPTTVPIKLVSRRNESSPVQGGHSLPLFLSKILAAFHK